MQSFSFCVYAAAMYVQKRNAENVTFYINKNAYNRYLTMDLSVFCMHIFLLYRNPLIRSNCHLHIELPSGWDNCTANCHVVSAGCQK